MTGFLRGFLGRRSDDNESKQQSNQPAAEQNSRAVFLDADEARTLGNVDYMRANKVVKRTFPKTVNNEEIELVQEISSMNKTRSGEPLPPLVTKLEIKPQDMNGTKAEGTAQSPSTSGSEDRRRTDTNLDMFRKMAKDIRKS